MKNNNHRTSIEGIFRACLPKVQTLFDMGGFWAQREKVTVKLPREAGLWRVNKTAKICNSNHCKIVTVNRYDSFTVSYQKIDKMPKNESKYKIKMIFLKYFPLYLHLHLKNKHFFQITHF